MQCFLCENKTWNLEGEINIVGVKGDALIARLGVSSAECR